MEISTSYTRCRLHVTQDFAQECTQNFKHTYNNTNILRHWIQKVALHFFERTCIDTRLRLNMRFVTFACNVKGWPRLSYPLVTNLAKYHREKHAWYARFGRVSDAKQEENVFQKTWRMEWEVFIFGILDLKPEKLKYAFVNLWLPRYIINNYIDPPAMYVLNLKQKIESDNPL